MFIKRTMLGLSGLLFTINAMAIPTTSGDAVLTSLGNEFTFTFDGGSGGVTEGSDGLYFSDSSIGFSLFVEGFGATGSAALRQQDSMHRGLGVVGGDADGAWEGGETLRVSLSDGLLFDLVGFSVNSYGESGIVGDCFTGNAWYMATASSGMGEGRPFNSADGCDDPPDAPLSSLMAGISFVDLADAGLPFDLFPPYGPVEPFAGYLESLTIRVDAPAPPAAVPEPAALGLFLLGLFGVAAARRKAA